MKLHEIRNIQAMTLEESIFDALRDEFTGRTLRGTADLKHLTALVAGTPEAVRAEFKRVLQTIHKSIAFGDYRQASLLKRELETKLREYAATRS